MITKKAIAEAMLETSVECVTFLKAIRNYDAGYGSMRHYGCLDRLNPFVRTPMNADAWVNYQCWVPNNRFSNGPESWRKITKQEDAGWIQKHNVFVADFDEYKINYATGEILGRQRSAQELINEIPAGVTLVPSKTPGNWSAVWVFETPITSERAKELRAHMVLFGADPGYYDTTLSHNPIHRHFFPQSDERVTIWNEAFSQGSVPYVLDTELEHPDYEATKKLVTKSSANLSPVHKQFWISEYADVCTVEELVPIMTGMREGEGRNPTIMKYLTLRTAELRKTQTVTFADAMNILDEGNALFAEPKSKDYLRNLASQHINYINAASKGGKVSAAKKIELAKQKYHLLFSQKEALRTNTLLLSTLVFSDEQKFRALEYGGRKGTTQHLAYALNTDYKTLENLLTNGKKKYTTKETS